MKYCCSWANNNNKITQIYKLTQKKEINVWISRIIFSKAANTCLKRRTENIDEIEMREIFKELFESAKLIVYDSTYDLMNSELNRFIFAPALIEHSARFIFSSLRAVLLQG